MVREAAQTAQTHPDAHAAVAVAAAVAIAAAAAAAADHVRRCHLHGALVRVGLLAVAARAVVVTVATADAPALQL